MKRCSLIVFLLFAASTSLASAASISIQAKAASTYDGWLPENGNTLDLLVSVSDYNHSEGELQFSFTEVSNWPGYCMNAGTGTKQDLCLYGAAQKKEVFSSISDAQNGTRAPGYNASHLTWETQSDGRTKARVSWTSDANLPRDFTIALTITSEDYGAFGTLQARLYKKRFGLLPFDIEETASIKIPKDNNNNKIADAWEVTANGWTNSTKKTTDEEAGANLWRGDGFVAYEEYRGFLVNSVHTRLNLNRKDVFVHSEFDPIFYPQLLTRDQVRLGPATTAAGIPQNGFPSVFKVWFIARNEMDSNSVVNFNECIRENAFEYWRVSQKAIHIQRNATQAYQAGAPWSLSDTSTDYKASHTHSVLTHTHGGVPHDVFDTTSYYTIGDTTIYTLQIDGAASVDALTSTNTQTALYTKALGNTVSHEFAHHLGLADHDVSAIVREHATSTPQNLVPSSVNNNN